MGREEIAREGRDGTRTADRENIESSRMLRVGVSRAVSLNELRAPVLAYFAVRAGVERRL